MRETEQGEVCCFDRLEAALTEAELVVEAVAEDLLAKQELFERGKKHILDKVFVGNSISLRAPFYLGISHMVKPKVVLTTNSLRLKLDDIFSRTAYKEVYYTFFFKKWENGVLFISKKKSEVPGHATLVSGAGHPRGGAQDEHLHHAIGRRIL